MKPKFTEYERRQIQAMMRKQMPWRKNLVLGSDNILRWIDENGAKMDMWFDSCGLNAIACKRWQMTAYRSIGDYDITVKCVLRRNAQKEIDRWRYSESISKIVVSDCLKKKQYVIENTLPTGMQVMDLLDTLETEFKMSAQEMDELLHIVGGWSPNNWNTRQRHDRLNRTKALWRTVAAMVGQFLMMLKGYDIFKAHGFDGHFVGFKEK
jgi:hypothetical protein